MVGYLLQPIIQIENSDGKPLEGGKVYVYKLGITPPVLADTYFDFQGHLNTNPIILDSLGHCTIIAEDDTAYDVIIKNKDDELQFSIHNATVMGGSGEIVIENEPVSVIEGNGLKVEKETLLDGTIQYTVSNNAINPTDKGEANFVLGKDNYVESNYSFITGENNNLTGGSCSTVAGKNNNVEITNDHGDISVIGQNNEARGYFYGGAVVNGSYNKVTVSNEGASHGFTVQGSYNEIKNTNSLYDSIIVGSSNNIEAGENKSIFDSSIIGNQNRVNSMQYGLHLFGYNNDVETYIHNCGLIAGSYNSIDSTNRTNGVDNIVMLGNYNNQKVTTTGGGKIIGDYNTIDYLNYTTQFGPHTGEKYIVSTYNHNIFGVNNEIYAAGNNVSTIGTGNKVYGFYNSSIVGKDNKIGTSKTEAENSSEYNYECYLFGHNNTIDNVKNYDGSYGQVADIYILGTENNVKQHEYLTTIIGNNNESLQPTNPTDISYDYSTRNVIIGEYNTYTNLFRSSIIGARNDIKSRYNCQAISVLGYQNKTDVALAESQLRNTIIGDQNELSDTCSHDDAKANPQQHSTYDNYIIGYHNKMNSDGTSYGFIFGRAAKIENKTNKRDTKLVIGEQNEDKADNFLEIAKDTYTGTQGNILEVKYDDSIYYKYNGEMIQLKPSNDNLVLVSTDEGQPEYKTFDEMFELIEQGKYLVLVSGIPGVAFFFPVKSVTIDSIDFDGYDRIVSYKNDNTTEIIERKMVCAVDNVTQQLSQTFENIKKCLDNNGDVVVKLNIVGYNMYSLLHANAVTQEFILFSSTYIPNESTTPHTLTLKLNSDESIEIVEG